MTDTKTEKLHQIEKTVDMYFDLWKKAFLGALGLHRRSPAIPPGMP